MLPLGAQALAKLGNGGPLFLVCGAWAGRILAQWTKEPRANCILQPDGIFYSQMALFTTRRVLFATAHAQMALFTTSLGTY